MAELDAGDGILLLDEFRKTAERLDKGIVPDAEIADGTAAAPLDLGRFHHHEARAAGGELAGIIRCQSVGKPLMAEYWCIGGTRRGCATRRPGSTSGKTAAFPTCSRFLTDPD